MSEHFLCIAGCIFALTQSQRICKHEQNDIIVRPRRGFVCLCENIMTENNLPLHGGQRLTAGDE